MKQTLLLSTVLVIFSTAFAQKDQWTWVSGDNTANQPGVYGIKGVAGAANKPGAREASVSWTDASGNLWLFGGFGNTGNGNGYLNDLWKYTASSGQWTWISGSNIPAQRGSYGTRGVEGANNTPGARLEAYAFTDASGNFWLFGGAGYTASGQGLLNDLWRYSPSTNQWTWMSGDTIQDQLSVYGVLGIPAVSNKPGARYWGVSGGVDAAGNLLLYGGIGRDASSATGINYLGDLWKYSISSRQWTWVAGTNIGGVAPVYGIKGVAGPATRPGGRSQSAGWTDASGNFWLFGGINVSPFLNDLWKHDFSTGWWTWVSGSNTASQGGSYGTKGVADPSNTPGARADATTQRDASGNLLLFGGSGRVPSNQLTGPLNDLWSYSPASGQWTWINGDNTQTVLGQYGTKGTPAPANKPGSRSKLVSWLDPAGNFWLFGGSGVVSTPVLVLLNDLWKYTFPASPNLNGVNGLTARKESQTVTLSWTGSQDPNIRSFSIERYNGTVTGYQSIGTVQATTISSPRYSFTDNTPLPGINFYRIRQIDQAGSAAYSSTAQVDMDQYNTRFSVYQNPVQNKLQLIIQLPDKQKVTLQVRDLNGHVLIRQEQAGYAGSGSFSVPVERLGKGTYLIQVQSESINSTKTFIKQ